ncbi:Isochorismatase hydrolase [Syntrophobacter sp. SbD1]|nr:Isochorismatase hydrolase [Syntrophobacter sp. SbD1]
MKRRVLLVIDLLNDFLNPAGVLYCGDEARKIIPVIRSLIDEFSAGREPVIFLRDAHAHNDKEFELFAPHAIKGSWGSEVIPELAPGPGSYIVDKTRFSGLFGNRLPDMLAEFKPDEVWVTGVLTSMCVMDTTGDLRNRDYAAVIPVDAVADIDPVWHEFALERMKKIYGARLTKTGADEQEIQTAAA